MPTLPGNVRPEQNGVAGMRANATGSVLSWSCAFCDLLIEVPYDPVRQLMPAGWTHVLIQIPGVARVSLVCDGCAERLTLKEIRDREEEAHKAWVEAEKRWILESLGGQRAILEAEQRRIAAELRKLGENGSGHADHQP